MRARRMRLSLAATIVVVMSALAGWSLTTAYGVLGGDVAVAQYYYEDNKVTICHKGKSTITVSESAVPAHQEHGDTIGPCPTDSSLPEPADP
jgi:hypothetical protein